MNYRKSTMDLSSFRSYDDRGCALPSDTVTFPEDTKCLPYMFECPVCMEFLTGKVNLCSSGHSMCSDCFHKLKQSHSSCPLCRKDLSPSCARNYFLEDLAAICVFKCKHHERGCSVRTKGHYYNIHLKECPHRDYNCSTFSLEELPSCNEKPRPLKDFLHHLQIDHRVPVIENGSWIKRRFRLDEEVIAPALLLMMFDDQVFFFHTKSIVMGPVQLPMVYQYQFNRWVIKVDNEEDSNSTSNIVKDYRYEISTEHEKSDPAVTEWLNKIYALPPYNMYRTIEQINPREQSELQTGTREGNPVRLSSYPRDFRPMQFHEDENTSFGFTVNNDLSQAPPQEVFAWSERIVIKKWDNANS